MLSVDQLLAGVARFMEERIPFNRHMGLKVPHIEPGRIVLRLPWADHLVGDPHRPALHGGVTSFLLDNAGGIAAFSTFTTPHDRCSTIDLRIDYVGPGPVGQDLYAEARVIRRGKRVVFCRMEAYGGAMPAADEERTPFAIGQATYSIFSNDARERTLDD